MTKLAKDATGLLCPYCNSTRHRVVESRPTHDTLRRRRLCIACKGRFSTVETIVPERYRTELPGPGVCTPVQLKD